MTGRGGQKGCFTGDVQMANTKKPIHSFLTQLPKMHSRESSSFLVRFHVIFIVLYFIFLYQKEMHWPGIEPGPPAWQARILPLNHQCHVEYLPMIK